jgi:maleylacetate reductase
LCHAIAGTHRLGHGEVHSVLLPYVAAYNAAAAPAALSRVAAALGTTDAPFGLRALAEALGAPTGLASLGLPRPALDDLVDETLVALGDRNPRRADPASLRHMLDDAYAGIPPGTS